MGRRGRYGFWFPLALLGFLMLGAAAVATWPVTPEPGPSTPLRSTAYSQQLSAWVRVAEYGGGEWEPPHTTAEYLFVALLVALVAVVVWYGWGTNRVRALVFTAVGSAIGAVASLLPLGMVASQPELGGAIGGSLVALGLCGAAWVYFGLGPGRHAALMVTAVSLAVGISVVLSSFDVVPVEMLAIVSGLLVLAWLDRSVVLTGVTGAFLVVAWLVPQGMSSFVLAAAVLLMGAVTALVLRARATPVDPG